MKYISYYDVRSLYPFVCTVQSMPSDHAEILTEADIEQGKFDINNFFGICRACVLAPRGERFPCLPMRKHDRLMFYLCEKCSDNLDKNHTCCCKDSDRQFTGVFTHIELQLAIKKKYQIIKIYEAWVYHEFMEYDPGKGNESLFSEYMKLLFRYEF